MNRFELVIFDCDGVLVDSEMITNRVFCEMLNDLGVEVTLEDMFERFVGNSMARCVEIIAELRGSPPPEGFIPELREKAGATLRAEVEAVPGASEVVNSLGIPYCVASSGEPEKIHLTLGKTGFLDRFEGKIFSVVEVEKPKPEPDIFLHAASKMGAEPNACAVIEDTPTGVRAAVAAGMYVYGFAAHTPEHRLREAGAHEIFSQMSALPPSLASHCQGGG